MSADTENQGKKASQNKLRSFSAPSSEITIVNNLIHFPLVFFYPHILHFTMKFTYSTFFQLFFSLCFVLLSILSSREKC